MKYITGQICLKMYFKYKKNLLKIKNAPLGKLLSLLIIKMEKEEGVTGLSVVLV